jgi:hypothetical protein
MELIGKIIKILPLQSGQGKNGEWRKQEFVVQTDGPYPKQVCFTMWNAKIDNNPLEENKQVTVAFDPESREFNNRWYTDLIAWRVQAASDNQQAHQHNTSTDVNDFPEVTADDATDDLPF